MSLQNISIAHPASVISPVNFLPIFFLIFQEDNFMIQVLPNFNNNFRTVIGHTSKRKTFNAICYVSDSIYLGLWIFRLDSSLEIIVILRKKMDASSWKGTQKTLWGSILPTQVWELLILVFQRQLDQILIDLECDYHLFYRIVLTCFAKWSIQLDIQQDFILFDRSQLPSHIRVIKASTLNIGDGLWSCNSQYNFLFVGIVLLNCFIW